MDIITTQGNSQVSSSTMDAVQGLDQVDSSQSLCLDQNGRGDSHQCLCLDDSDPVHRLCLSGLTVLPIPSVDKITDIFRQAENHGAQLATTSNQETLIYRNATTAHLDALAAHIDTTRAKALAEYLDALGSPNHSDDRWAAHRNYHNAIGRDGTYPGLVTFFGNDSGLLFFKMSSMVSSSAQNFLHRRIVGWGVQMGLELAYWPYAVQTHKQKDQQKQIDWSVQPLPLRGSGNHFPTVVIEQGSSQMGLRKEKDWWFENSPPDHPQGDVKMVVLIKLDRPAKSITVEVWDRDNVQVQTVTITPHPEESLSTEVRPPWRFPLEGSCWVVKGGPLVIPFESVFLRPKKTKETDLVIDDPTFVMMARQAWRSELPAV